jgi:acyl-CoA dehydrogenase
MPNLPSRLASPRIAERRLGIAGDPEALARLEGELEAFAGRIAGAPIDESDEQAAARSYVRHLADAGLLGLCVPARYGGRHEHVSSTSLCVARQWLARTSGALDTAFAMQGLGSYPITLGGSEALKERVLPAVARGDSICAFALSEAEAGSDVANMQTVAEPVDGGVRIRGRKIWISNAGIADSYVVFAREADTGERPRFGAFWLPGDAQGLQVEPVRVIAPHPIGTLALDVFVPDAHRLGAPGSGLRIALGTLDVFRVTVGAAALGLADRALEDMVAHLRTRIAFGKPLAEQQGLRFAVADVATAHLAAQLLVYRAAAARDDGTATPDMAAMAKMFATKSAQRTIDRAVQSFGGLGVTVGHVAERLYREVRALRIYEGATEIQKLVIARTIFDAPQEP